ncbi:hypothetical protein B0H13DRAFT_2081341 [Mycena leptocephala]|nr:hypothetical protein B0H13DRAFT_2081341 [Mycena leptocephala]
MANAPQSPLEGRPSESILTRSGSGSSPSAGGFISNAHSFYYCRREFHGLCTTHTLCEIRINHRGVVNRCSGRCAARRIYSARIHGTQSDMTVVVYQGENAEETWRWELAKYSGLWHPNIVQFHGAVNSGGIYATIFHDDLVPIEQFLDDYRQSVMSTVYLYAQFLEFNSISWIRRSMGRLCLEVEPNFADHALRSFRVPGSSNLPNLPMSGLGTDQEMSIIHSLTFEQFHRICYWYLCTSLSRIVHDEIQLGTIISLHGENVQEIAHIPNIPFTDRGWTGPWTEDGPRVLINMENGWSRLYSSCVNGSMTRALHIGWDTASECWLSQANHVFSQLLTPKKREHCFLIHWITYQLLFSGLSGNLPEGYLFLGPLEDLRGDNGAWFPTNECPAYWSLDPSGSQRLSPEEVSRLRFPSLKLEMKVHLLSWPESVYEGLSRFHAARGFDPNGQDLARHLGQPLYEISASSRIATASSEYLSVILV